jgi:hypothetical protein
VKRRTGQALKRLPLTFLKNDDDNRFYHGLAAAWPAGTGHHLTDADSGECSAYLKLHLYIMGSRSGR